MSYKILDITKAASLLVAEAPFGRYRSPSDRICPLQNLQIGIHYYITNFCEVTITFI